MAIEKFLKPGKNMVIDIEGIEYLIDDDAFLSIERGDQKISLIQLYDYQRYLFDSVIIVESIRKNGVIDYLDKKLITR